MASGRGTTPQRRPAGRPTGRPSGQSAKTPARPLSNKNKKKAQQRTQKTQRQNTQRKAANASQRQTHAKRRAGNIGGDQIEGRHAVHELLLAGKREVREVFLVAGQDQSPILHEIIDLSDEAKIPIRQVSRSRFETLSRTESPQGVVALAAPLRPVSLEDLVEGGTASSTAPATKPFIVIVDSVVDPHNLGALMRTAEAAGVTGFVFSRHNSPRISPTVAKVAAGAVEHLPIAQASSIPSALRELTSFGIWNVGLDAGAETPIWDMNLADEPLSLVLGSEEKGLSRLVKQSCDQLVSIPLTGVISSLNVSAAGAVAVFEVKRKRSEHSSE